MDSIRSVGRLMNLPPTTLSLNHNRHDPKRVIHLSNTEFLQGPCPECGNELQIPSHLTEFSCLYCGKRLTPADLVPAEPPRGDFSDARAQALELLPKAIYGYPNSIRHLTAKDYPGFFARYAEENRAGFAALELAAALAGNRDAFLRETAQAVLTSTEDWQQRHRAPLDDLRYTLCLYCVPALCREAPKAGSDFSAALRQAWLDRHPKQSFQLSTYEEIAQGFRPRKLCFITTAACAFANKDDRCEELTAFRRFRDGYMSEHSPCLVEEYYEVAPAIVLAIRLLGDPRTEYPRIWREELGPCYRHLCRGEESACLEGYRNMVLRLRQTYLGDS